MILIPFRCEVREGHWGNWPGDPVLWGEGSAGKRDNFGNIQQQSWTGEGQRKCSIRIIRVVHGWRVRGSSTAEAVEIQSIHKEETLSAQNQPTTGARPSQPNQPWRLSKPNWATWSKLKAGSALGRVWTGCLLWSSPELFCKPMNYSPSSISAAAGPFIAKSARVPCHGPLKVRFRRASCGNTGTLVQWEPLRPLQMCSSGHLPVVHKHLTGSTSARAKLFEWYPVMGKQRRERCPAYKPKRGKKHLNVRKHIFPARGLILFRRLPGEEAATPTPEGTPASAAPAPGHRRGPTALGDRSGTGRPPSLSAVPPRPCPACPAAALPAPRRGAEGRSRRRTPRPGPPARKMLLLCLLAALGKRRRRSLPPARGAPGAARGRRRPRAGRAVTAARFVLAALRLAGAALLSPGSCTFEDSACGYQWDYAHLPWTLHGEGESAAAPRAAPPLTFLPRAARARGGAAASRGAAAARRSAGSSRCRVPPAGCAPPWQQAGPAGKRLHSPGTGISAGFCRMPQQSPFFFCLSRFVGKRCLLSRPLSKKTSHIDPIPYALFSLCFPYALFSFLMYFGFYSKSGCISRARDSLWREYLCDMFN